MALDESLTLENLGVALHDVRSPDARWLLEGYFSLKRQVLAELLVDCCAKASARDLNRLADLCFKLQDVARWESGAWCAQVEFELLRLAARVAERPGYVLLVQSLQRAFLGVADRLQPLMGGGALREWALCAMHALTERDTRALQHELPTRMKACDEHLLQAFAPVLQHHESPEDPHDEACVPGRLAPATAQDGRPEVCPGVEGQDLGDLAPASGDIERPGVPSALGGACDGPVAGAVLEKVSACPAGSGVLCPDLEHTHAVNPREARLRPGLLGSLGLWAVRLWCFIAR